MSPTALKLSTESQHKRPSGCGLCQQAVGQEGCGRSEPLPFLFCKETLRVKLASASVLSRSASTTLPYAPEKDMLSKRAGWVSTTQVEPLTIS